MNEKFEELTLNKSKTYMLPYINKFIEIKFIDSLRNTYLFFNSDYSFCLRYKFNGGKSFSDYEKYLETNEYHIRTIDISKNEVLFVFRLPDELYETADLFLSGKYSYMPDLGMVKSFLIKNFNIQIDSFIIKVLDRDQGLREALEEKLNVRIPETQDLSDPPDYDKENYVYND